MRVFTFSRILHLEFNNNMAQQRKKRKPEERGLLTRVAKITGTTVSMVSKVNGGKAVSRKISEALAREREAIRLGRISSAE
ncbi:MAG TPA: hypothetical protein VN442_11100 [Bryobacteraceae bacterium]|nr:hypothetical protein [Bryobacteraceae bacterium]